MLPVMNPFWYGHTSLQEDSLRHVAGWEWSASSSERGRLLKWHCSWSRSENLSPRVSPDWVRQAGGLFSLFSSDSDPRQPTCPTREPVCRRGHTLICSWRSAEAACACLLRGGGTLLGAGWRTWAGLWPCAGQSAGMAETSQLGVRPQGWLREPPTECPFRV